MAANVRTPTGELLQVEETELERRILAGEVRPTAEKVLVQSPVVGERWVRPDELQDALRGGFRLASDEATRNTELREQYGQQQTRAFAEGAARGATFGGSDWILREAGVSPEALRLRQEYNPAAAVTGEVLGGVLPFLATGSVSGTITGARAAAAGARAAPRLATILGEQALRGAAEGTVIGLGQAVSDAALERDPLTVQKALAAAGTGAFFGAALGAPIGAAGELSGRLFGRARRGLAEAVTPDAPAVTPEVAATRAAQAAPEVSPGARVAGEAVPPGAAPPGAPPGMAGGAPPPPPEDFLESIIGRVVKTVLPTKEAIEKNPTFLNRVLAALDIRQPDANEAVLRGLGEKQKWIRKLDRKGLKSTAPEILRQDPRFANVRNLDQAAELIATKLDDFGRQYDAQLGRLDELATDAERIEWNEVADQIRDQVLGKYRQGPAAVQSVGNTVEEEIARLRQRANEGPVTLREAEARKRDFDPLARFNSQTPPLDMTRAQAFEDIRRVIKRSIEDKADAIAARTGADAAATWRTAKQGYGAMRELSEMAEDTINSRTSNRFFSLTDNMAGMVGAIAGGGLNPVGFGLALSASLLNKWGRENFPWVLAKALTQHNGNPGAKAAAEALQRAVKGMGADDVARVEAAINRPVTLEALRTAPGAPAPPSSAGAPGPVQPAPEAIRREAGPALVGFLRRAAEGTAADVWGAHLILSGSQEYREELARRGWDGFLLPEDESEANAQGQQVADAVTKRLASLDAEARPRARALATLQERAAQLDKRVTVAAKAALAGEARTPRPRELPAGAMRRLAELAERPEAFEAAVAQQLGPLPALLPGAGGVAIETLGRAVQHLSSVAPKPPGGPLAAVPALRQPWIANSLDVERFEQALAAIQDPASVVEALAAGQVSPASVQAVQAVYPELLEDFRAKVLDALVARQEPLDYGQRIQLSLLLGQPLDESLQASTLSGLQMAHAPPQEAPQARPAPARTPPLTAGLTPSQQLSAKGAA